MLCLGAVMVWGAGSVYFMACSEAASHRTCGDEDEGLGSSEIGVPTPIMTMASLTTPGCMRMLFLCHFLSSSTPSCKHKHHSTRAPCNHPQCSSLTCLRPTSMLVLMLFVRMTCFVFILLAQQCGKHRHECTRCTGAGGT